MITIAAFGDTARNASDLPTLIKMQTIANKMDEWIAALRR